MAGKTHFLDPSKIHYKWDNSLSPALKVDPGDIVEFELREVSGGQITPKSTNEDVGSLELDTSYPLGGPIYVKEAGVGDVLEVEILDIRMSDWGWSAILPGFGLLPEEFSKPYVTHWDLSNGTTSELKPGITVKLDPFPGVMGVAPTEKGSFHPLPPGNFGGNIDIRHLTKGTTLLLPVWNEGALFSCGDCHAAQGDGEVCGFGIETSMWVTARLNVRKGVSIQEPQFITRGSPDSGRGSKGYHVTTGIGSDVMASAKKSVRYMVDHLVRTYRMTGEEAYTLCSIAADLRISEIVDKPNWIVSTHLPLSVFSS